jgi:hypothetical protein
VDPIEHAVAADVSAAVWLRLQRLCSATLCRRMLEPKFPGLSSEAITRKGEGVASAMRSALGYWQTAAIDLNSRILTRYYALLQVSIAEQVAQDAEADLDGVQRKTEQGHGFAALSQSAADFPANYYIAALRSGHFAAYAKSRGFDISSSTFDQRPRTWDKVPDTDRPKLISMRDLLRRVPELQGSVRECFEQPALSFAIGQSLMNTPAPRRPAPAQLQTTLVNVYTEPNEIVNVAWLESLDLPLVNFKLTQSTSPGRTHFVGELEHSSAHSWWSCLPWHKSDYCPTSILAPFWGLTDAFALHLSILYGLSIVVRYLPSVWFQVDRGALDHVRVLLENYMAIVDRAGPPLAYERITGTRLEVVTPGSLNSPV